MGGQARRCQSPTFVWYGPYTLSVFRHSLDDMSFQLYLEPTDTDRFTISVANFGYRETPVKGYTYGLMSGTAELRMIENLEDNAPIPYQRIVHESMASWRVYHFMILVKPLQRSFPVVSMFTDICDQMAATWRHICTGSSTFTRIHTMKF